MFGVDIQFPTPLHEAVLEKFSLSIEQTRAFSAFSCVDR
jgi:hypothetical protein